MLFCSAAKSLSASAVPKKGPDQDGYTVKQTRKDLIRLGHPSVMIRSGKDLALLHVVDTSVAALKAKGVIAAAGVPCLTTLRPTERLRTQYGFSRERSEPT